MIIEAMATLYESNMCERAKSTQIKHQGENQINASK
jgi:hypothetical protein